MDWNNVTVQEVASSLREVDWSQAPRPLSEFLTNFSTPKTEKLVSRLKCNVYFYRTNYAILFALSFIVAFLRNPGALLALLICIVAGLFQNDTFAATVSDRILRMVRKVSPQAAHKLRSHTGGGHASLGAPGKSKPQVQILGIPRTVLTVFLGLIGTYLLYYTQAMFTLALAGLVGDSLVLLHAAFRTPNLKARLASAKEEFRAMWRGYQAEHDYTL